MDIAKTRIEFERGFEMSLDINQTFQEKIRAIFTRNEWDSKQFCDQTGLEPIMFSRMNQPGYTPNMRTLTAVCMALKLDVPTTEDLLKSVGLAFSPVNRVHRAYVYLLENCKDVSIEDCNTILTSFGIGRNDLLGTIQRK